MQIKSNASTRSHECVRDVPTLSDKTENPAGAISKPILTTNLAFSSSAIVLKLQGNIKLIFLTLDELNRGL